MKKHLCFALAFLLPAFIESSSAQNIKFKTYTVEDGLSNNSINKIINDPSGGIWIATWDGLNFFDGQVFDVYKHDPQDSSSLAGNFIYDMVHDENGRLWIWSGIRTISLYLGQKEFRNFHFDENIQEMGSTNERQVVVASSNQIFLAQGESFRECISCTMRAGSNASLEKLLLTQYPKLSIKDSFRDPKGNIWYATLTNGLYILPYSEENMQASVFHNYQADISDPYALKSSEVYCINEDVFGNIWLGLKDGGISMAFKNSTEIATIASHPARFPELPNETIRAINQDNEGRIWLGFYNSGVYYSDLATGRFVPFDPDVPNESNDWRRIRSIYKDSEGSVWIGTYGGLIRSKDLKDIAFFSHPSEPYLQNNRHYDLIEDPSQNCLWIACWGGISKFDLIKKTFVPFEGQEQLSPYHIRKLELVNGVLYAATENNGILILENDSLRFLNYEKGLPDNSVYSLFYDGTTENIWAGTLGGISIFDKKGYIIKNLNEKDGLQSQLVYGLLPGDNFIWASTTKGIAAVDRLDYKINLLPAEEGWQSAEFSEGAYFQNSRGTMFFAGVKGLNYFHPNKINLTYDIPKLQIEKLSDEKASGISVKVRAISFTRNPNNKIVYKLEPLEKDWKTLPESQFIQFENLKPGSYHLMVKNSEDHSPDAAAGLTFEVPLPYWKSPLFLVLVFSAFFIAILYWRHVSNKTKREKLEALIKERTQVIEEQKKALLAINSDLDRKNKEINIQKSKLLALHNQQKSPDLEMEKFKDYILKQFRSPLLDIKYFLETGGYRSNREKQKTLSTLDAMIKDLKDWEKISILDHLKDSQKSLTVLPQLIENLTKELGLQLKKKDISLFYDYQLPENWVEMDVWRLKLFFHCLFREIIKFAENGSELIIQAWAEDKQVHMEMNTNSDILSANFSHIMEYSPYIRSARKILFELGGSMSLATEPKIHLNITIPFSEVSEPKRLPNTIHWKHLDLNDRLHPNKFNLLILARAFESDGLLRMLNDESYNLIVEEEVKMVASAIKHTEIDVLILYNQHITQPVIDLIETIKSQNEHKIGVPIIYVYELIDDVFQEKLMDLGVETFIQLPASSSFILKKINSRLQIRRIYLEEKKLQTFMDEDHKENIHFSPNEKLVKQAMLIIKEEYTNSNFRVESLSKSLGISKIKCYRAFKEVMGNSPSDIIIKLRLEKAEKLLVKKKMNISEVGFECGFNDPKYFSKLFKKHYGISPKSFA
ncbi:AraC family transcriptional regulator [Negadavirga shengliensis]|uniref:AraC family transcriptional regulator n=1 Tax=Negadavirga shengliensis TaxID=1389218 RepID=A0ABV9T288_9BACT